MKKSGLLIVIITLYFNLLLFIAAQERLSQLQDHLDKTERRIQDANDELDKVSKATPRAPVCIAIFLANFVSNVKRLYLH